MPGIRSLFVFLPALALILSCASGGPLQGGAGSGLAADPDSLVTAGRTAAGSGDYARAKEMFDAALMVDPHNVEARRGLAEMSVEMGDPVSAVYYYERLLELSGDHTRDYIELARVLEKSGRGDGALVLLTEATAAHPNQAQLHRELGYVLLERGETDKALQQLRLAVDMGAGVTAHRKLADTLFQLERYQDAAAVLESYNERYPGDFDVNMKLAYIYFDRGNHESALPFYRAAVDADPKSVDARVGLAKTLEALDRTDNAIRIYDGILEMRGLTREMEPIIISQANLLNKRGKYARALDLVENAADQFPETPGLSCARGMALAGEGRYEEAAAAFSLATGDPRWSEFANAQIRRIQSIRRGQ
jgi:tetratricopeptide (TPR) repeat protein